MIGPVTEYALEQTKPIIEKLEQELRHAAGTERAKETTLTPSETRQLDLVTKLIPHANFTPEDWYQFSSAQFAIKQFEDALTSINRALENPASLNDIRYAKYMLSKAMCYGELKQPDKEIACYSELIDKYVNSTEPAIQKQVAIAFSNKGATLLQSNKIEEALLCYNELIKKLGENTEPTIQLATSRALFNKSVIFGKSNKLADAIQSYSELVEKFGMSPNLEIQTLVAKALFNIAGNFGKQSQIIEAIAYYDELFNKFGQSEAPELKQTVADALANSAELAIFVEQPPQVLERVKRCESYRNNLQNLAVMQFIRFLLNDKPIDAVLDFVRLFTPETELTWQFSEIRPYIYQHFSGTKLQQCQAVIDFFEQHKDVKRLASELGLA